MTFTSIIYDNSLMTVENFIDIVLYPDIQKNQVPLCKIKEASDLYYINIKFFFKNKHIFEVYYKNNFLILQVKLKDSSKKVLLTRMFYLNNINLNKISHIYSKDELQLTVPKIYSN